MARKIPAFGNDKEPCSSNVTMSYMCSINRLRDADRGGGSQLFLPEKVYGYSFLFR